MRRTYENDRLSIPRCSALLICYMTRPGFHSIRKLQEAAWYCSTPLRPADCCSEQSSPDKILPSLFGAAPPPSVGAKAVSKQEF